MDAILLCQQRHQWLVERVQHGGRVLTATAAEELRVSVDTIRRDLRQLDRDGAVRRVHGGAVRRSGVPASYAERLEHEPRERSRLAGVAVALFQPGMVIGLDAGTTNVDVARLIPPDLEITIVTNNPPAAAAISPNAACRVVLIGGQLDRRWMATTGPQAADAWNQYRLDIGLLGVCALDAELGASTNSLDEVATKRALISSAADVVVIADASKLGTSASFVIGPAVEISRLITHDATPRNLLQPLATRGIEILVDGVHRKAHNG
jgi:DeoR/GlpR family transcriptional regulator of sugar metabolism